MDIEEIRELIKLGTETGVAELEVQQGENRVRVRFGFSGEVPEISVSPRGVSGDSRPVPSSTPSSTSAQPAADPSLVLVKSPIVGTFYESASPDSPAFVRIGESVQPGKVLCIIESMKLMNEIEAEIAGVVENKFVMNGQPVEYGEALFAIRAV